MIVPGKQVNQLTIWADRAAPGRTESVSDKPRVNHLGCTYSLRKFDGFMRRSSRAVSGKYRLDDCSSSEDDGLAV
jgi:hypothetical protein